MMNIQRAIVCVACLVGLVACANVDTQLSERPLVPGAQGSGLQPGRDPTRPGAAGRGGDPTRPVDVEIPRDTIGKTAEVGTLEGTASVSSNGSFQYRIPLWVPRGRAGMEPDLAISYDSNGGNGVLGVGWSLVGGSSILRCSKNLSRDKAVDTINFDNDDNFCLDGQKLVEVERGRFPAEYPQPPLPPLGEYRTERESFTRVFAFGNGQPEEWVAFGKDRKVRHYGSNPDADMIGVRFGYYSTSTYGWLLSKVVDRRDNAIEYEYDTDPSGTAARLLRTIRYTAVPYGPYANAAVREIEFQYKDRDDDVDRYISGLNLRLTQRLETIVVRAPNPYNVEPVRSYHFGYDQSQRSKRSLLVSAQVCAANGGCLPATTLRYAQPLGPEPVHYVAEYHPTEWNTGSVSDLLVIDVNGDGFDDAIYSQRDELTVNSFFSWDPHLRLSIGQSQGAFALAPLQQRSLFHHDSEGSSSIFPQTFRAQVHAPIDVDGDGAQEWLAPRQFYTASAWPWDEFPLHHIYEWTGATMGLTSFWEKSWPYADSAFEARFATLDFNGDGLTDVASVVAGEFLLGEWVFDMNTFTSSPDPAFSRQLGYGLQHVLPSTRGLAIDIDGNGTRDLIEVKENHEFRVLQLKQGQFSVSSYYPQHLFEGVFADVNGDGLKDLVRPHRRDWPLIFQDPANEDQYLLPPTVEINTGLGFLPPYELSNLLYTGFRAPRYRVADLNGDGRDDLVLLQHRKFTNPPPNKPQDHRIWLSDGYGFYEVNLPQPLDLMFNTGTQLGDIDNDGTPEILSIPIDWANSSPLCEHGQAYGEDGNWLYCKQRLVTYRDVGGPEPFHDRLIEVIDGLGARQTVEYGAHSPNGMNDPDPLYEPDDDCEYPERCEVSGPPLVRVHNVKQPVGLPDRVQEYHYGGAVRDLQGRGRIGFRWMRMQDPLAHRVVETTYDLRREFDAYPYAGRPKTRTTTIGTTPDLYRIEQEFKYDFHWLIGRYRSDFYWKETREYEGQDLVRAQTREYRYDDYGNVEFDEHRVQGGSTHTVETEYENRANDWLIGLRHRQTVTNQAPDTSTAIKTFEYEHDASGLLETTIHEPDESPHADMWLHAHVDYDLAGVIVQSTLTRNGETRSESIDWDSDGVYPETMWNALGQPTLLGFHPAVDQLAVSIDPNDFATVYTYDGLGRPKGTKREDGWWSQTEYLAKAGWPLEIHHWAADGSEQSEQFDFFARPRGILKNGFEAGSSIRSDVIYDELGRVQLEFVPRELGSGGLPKFSTYSYDDRGRPTHVAHFDGTSESWSYPDFFTTVHTDVLGRTTTIGKNVDGHAESISRKNTVTGPLVTGITHGPFGRVKSVAGPGGVLSMTYDARGRRLTIDDPNTGPMIEHHNAFDELYYQEAANGDVHTFDYDDLGRLLTRDSPDGVDSFTWDLGMGAVGRLTSSLSADGVTVEHGYNSLGQQITERQSDGADSFEFGFDYDAMGRPHKILYPETPDQHQLVVRYDYQPKTSLLVQVYEETGQQLVWKAAERDPLERATRELYGSKFSLSTKYDPPTERVENVIGTGGQANVVYNVAYEHYENTGQLESRHDNVADVLDTAHYDELGRLERWTRTHNGAIRQRIYAFDGVNRLTDVSDSTAPITTSIAPEHYEYPPAHAPQRFAPIYVSNRDYKYDLSGRLEERKSQSAVDRTFQYNRFDLPAAGTANGASFSVSYTADGARFKKTFQGQDTVSVGNLFERRGTGGPDEHIYSVLAEGQLVAQYSYSIAQPGQFKPRYTITDLQGTVSAVVDENGTVSESLFYEPYGRRTHESGSLLGGPPNQSVLTGFTGHDHDDELGLIDMHGRVFDPQLRHFLSTDPVSNAPLGTGLSRYSYVSWDPFNRTDPTGFQEEPEPGPTIRVFDNQYEVICLAGCEKTDTFVNPYVATRAPETLGGHAGGHGEAATFSGPPTLGQQLGAAAGTAAQPDNSAAKTGVTVAAVVLTGVVPYTLFYLATNVESHDDPDLLVATGEFAVGAAGASIGRSVLKALAATRAGKVVVAATVKIGERSQALIGRGASGGAQTGGKVSVYRSVDAAGKVRYVGITNNLARRAAEHLRSSRGIQIEKLMGGLSRSDARAVEQALIQIHGLGKNGGTLLNKINSISPKNPAYADQLKRGYELLKTVGY